MTAAATLTPSPPPAVAEPISPQLPVRRMAANYLVLTAGECVAKALTFAAFVYLARILGPEEYGGLEFVLAAMIFFTLGADFGLGAYGAREVARNRNAGPALLREIGALRLLLACASFLVLLLCASLLPQSWDVKLLLILYGLNLFASPLLLTWFFQGSEYMHWVAICSIARQATFVVLLFLFVRPGTSLYVVGCVGCAAVLVEAAISFFATRRSFQATRTWTWVTWPTLLGHLRQAAPIGCGEGAWAFLCYFVTVLLGLAGAGTVAVGWFGVSHRIVMALHTFVWLYFFNLLPSMARCLTRPQDLRDLVRRSLSATCWAGLLVALVGTLFARDIMTLAYGAGFAEAGAALAILVWVIPIALVGGHYRFALLASNLQRLEFYTTATAATVAVAVGLVLIPKYEAVGAAIAMLAANVVSLVLAYVVVQRRILAIHPPAQLIGTLLAVVAGGAVFLAISGIDERIAAATAVGTYLLGVAFIAVAPLLFQAARNKRRAAFLCCNPDSDGR